MSTLLSLFSHSVYLHHYYMSEKVHIVPNIDNIVDVEEIIIKPSIILCDCYLYRSSIWIITE